MRLIDKIKYFFFNKDISLSGNFKNFQSINIKYDGYNHPKILNKTLNAELDVLRGKGKYSQDGITFKNFNYNFRIISFLFYGLKYFKNLNIVDYGGGFGNTFKEVSSIEFLEKKIFSWNIVEQKNFVKFGKKYFHYKKCKFTSELKFKKKKIHCLLFSSSLQYLEKPYEILDETLKLKPKLICIDRIALGNKEDFVSLQINPKYIYDVNYPVWVLNEVKFLKYFKKKGYANILNIDTKLRFCGYVYKHYLFEKI